jgi:hypothetical protein
MFITGPEVVKTVTGEEVTFEELGGAATHASKSGVAHFTAADEDACLEDARYLLSFLPQNNVDPPPYFEPSDPIGREDAELDTFVPDEPTKPYDMRAIVDRVVDDGEFFEVHELWAAIPSESSPTTPAHSQARSTSTRRSRRRASSASATRSTSRSSRLSTFPASCRGPRRSGAGSSGTAPSSSMPIAKRPCRRSPSSPARRTAAPTTS